MSSKEQLEGAGKDRPLPRTCLAVTKRLVSAWQCQVDIEERARVRSYAQSDQSRSLK